MLLAPAEVFYAVAVDNAEPKGLARLIALRTTIDAARALSPMSDLAMDSLSTSLAEIDEAIVDHPSADRGEVALKVELLAKLLHEEEPSDRAEARLCASIMDDRERLLEEIIAGLERATH